MFGIFNLAVNINFSLLQNDSDAEDYERTCTMGILTISRVFILQRNDLQNCNKIEKTANPKSFVSAGILADEKSILHTWKYDVVLYFPF